jgi:hypothetical protein
MILTLEQFQKDAKPWLEKLKETGETLLLLAGPESYELRSAGPVATSAVSRDLVKLLPKRDLIDGDPESLIHLDWSSEWRL